MMKKKRKSRDMSKMEPNMWERMAVGQHHTLLVWKNQGREGFMKLLHAPHFLLPAPLNVLRYLYYPPTTSKVLSKYKTLLLEHMRVTMR